jgi:hypothetical protein
MPNQLVVVQGGLVIQAVASDIKKTTRPQIYSWDGPALTIGDPAPEGLKPVDVSVLPNTALIGNNDPVQRSIEVWFEIFGDWINQVHYQLFGRYRSRAELLAEWTERMSDGN